MKKRKVLPMLLAMALVASTFTGCGEKPKEETADKTDKTEAAADQVEITWWAFPTFATVDDVVGQYEQGLADKYMEENAGVKVKVEMLDFTNGPDKIITAIQGGTAPNVLFDAPGRIIDYGTSGYLVGLDDMIAELEGDITSDSILSASADKDGNYWMYPTSAAPFIMAVNKTALEAEGLFDMVPQDGSRTWTTEEFKALSVAMAEKGYKGMEIYSGGPGGDQGTRSSIANLTGASIMNDDLTAYTMSDEAGVAAFTMVKEGSEEGWLTSNTAGQANDALEHFTTPGGATFWAVNLWSPNLAAGRAGELEASGIEAYPVNMPSESGNPELEYLVNGYCVFNNDDAAKVEASKDFIAWLADDEEVGKANVIATNCFPVRESFGNLYEGNEEMEFYASLSSYYGSYYNTVPGFAEMRPFWWGSLQAMATGDMTPEEAVASFDSQANETLK